MGWPARADEEKTRSIAAVVTPGALPEWTIQATPWWLGPEHPRSKVVEVASMAMLRQRVVDEPVVGEILGRALQALTDTDQPDRAWRAILGDAERIVVKFNHVGADVLATNEPVARVVVGSLADSGYDPKLVTLAEVPQYLRDEMGVARPSAGWGTEISVEGQTEAIASYYDEADAVVNVSLLKTHRIAGMSASLKNVSHGVIRHPGRHHGQRCSRAVAEVLGHGEIHHKLRLNIVNAIRTVVRNGPDADPADVRESQLLLLGHDPVAVDTVAHAHLLKLRQEVGMAAPVVVPYLDLAGRVGVGRARPHELERVVLRLR